MRIRVQRHGKTVVLDLHGGFTVGVYTTPLREIVGLVTWLRMDSLVLNLENVSRLDCSGVGQLVAISCEVQKSGANIALAKMDPRQKQILGIMRLLPILNVCDTLENAIRSCERPPQRVPVYRAPLAPAPGNDRLWEPSRPAQQVARLARSELRPRAYRTMTSTTAIAASE